MSTAPSIEFDDNDISGLTANGITESMYSSCNNEGNKYLMMDLFVNHTSNDKDVSKTDSVWSIGDAIHCISPLRDDTSASSGRTGPPPGSPSRT